jgi:tRNA pseudouridine38-40 synthase
VDIEALNKDLPTDIKVFAVKKVTKGFNSKSTCDARTYSYTLPTYAFAKEDEQFTDSTFRLTPERFEELNKILAMYHGTKNFHNFTIRKEPHDPSVRRFIMSFESQPPHVPDNTEVEFARLKITGQSFMMHQIRRMVGLVIAIMRGYVTADVLTKALERDRLLIPQAPGLGLVLDNVHYTRYNERYGDDGVHEPLTFEKEEEAVEEFFKKNIMTTIIETELKEMPMKDWVGGLKNHNYERPEKGEPEADSDGNNSD